MSSPRIVNVDLAGRAYDIVIGPTLIDKVGELSAKLLKAPRVIVVTDETVGPLYGERLVASFAKAGVKAATIVVPAGEASKQFAPFGALMNRLLDQQPDRKTTLVALGGGVVGDLTGFAASVLLRGVDFIQVPTTLLSQVDSSVGGKTGINTRHGKNLVGTFYQPRLVVADTEILDTLPRLNLGHTFGHALEAETGFGADLLHGEAVGAGMAMAFDLSAQLGLCPVVDAERVRKHLGEVGLPVRLRTIGGDNRRTWSAPRLIEHMRGDKKAEAGSLTFILARGIGKSFVTREVDEQALNTLLAKAIAT
jgi:3-dehydroquinate synthetase